ncbi:DNA ligase D [Bryobacter aggregatus]|uniref:DNA ligase D n=1 Tax=Bryobacter aggregatus TaxID=360054 RepID=UPI0004E24161|nr:DNA ligase D [Bryobacter aggregatus]
MPSKLREYASKRNFKKTAEPKPGRVAKKRVLQPGEESKFFIQRHDASHLHYDFRLLIDGTLKSWAIPRGPTLDPAVKRLAVEVEDHPLSYGDFEGTIPEGEYGGGSVMLWDRGTFELLGELDALAQLEKGDLKFRMHGEKLKGEFALVRTRMSAKKPQWLLIKKKDAEAASGWDIEKYAVSVRSSRKQEEIAQGKSVGGGLGRRAMPTFEKPMLATLSAELPAETGWAYEVKWDGVRVLCAIDGEEVILTSRNGLSYSAQFPELQVLSQCFAGHQVVVDGEIVALDLAGKPSFQALQPRIGLRGARMGTLPKLLFGTTDPVHLFLFDLLFLDGKDLRNRPFVERKAALTKIFHPELTVHLSEHFVTGREEILRAARENGLEGVIAKKLDSPYQEGRSRDWLKVKFHLRQEFAICGWIEGKRKIGSLVLGVREGKEWVWCGNVGAGFSEATIGPVLEQLERAELKQSVFKASDLPSGAHWVRPELVAEVEFAQWTEEGKLRSPVFLGIRPDRRPADCRREKPILSAKRARGDLKLTHLEKIYFPEDGITKGQLLDYYDAVSEYLLPYLKDRPLSLRRYPNGIHGQSFFQKNLPENTPSWLETVVIDNKDSAREIRYAVAQDRDSLLYLVNLGCIDHNPWMSRIQKLDEPDFLLIDLDPYESDFPQVVEAALCIRLMLDELKLKSWVKTSGGHGMHVVVPLLPGHSYPDVSEFTGLLAGQAVERWPTIFTTERTLKKRPKRHVYFDHVQVGRGKTIAAPYSVRPYPGAPVGTPLAWDEVRKSLKPSNFHMGNILKRLGKIGDLYHGVLGRGQRLPLL